MAYNPSFGDIPQGNSYQPSFGDIQPKSFKTPYGQQVQGGFTGTPSQSDFSSAFQHLGAIGQDVGRDIVNLPNTFFPGTFKPTINPNYDFYKSKGLQKGITDDVGKELAEFSLPAGIANKAVKASGILMKAPNLAKNVIGTSLYSGYENKKNQLSGTEGMVNGAEAGLLGTMFGKAVDKGIIQPAAKFIGRQAINPLASKALPGVKGTGDPNANAQAFQLKHDAQVKKEDALWDYTRNEAKALDNSPPILKEKILRLLTNPKNAPIDNSNYLQHIADYEERARKMTPSDKVDYHNVLDFIDDPKYGAKAIAPRSLEDVISNRRNINTSIQKFIKERNLPEDAQFKQFSKGLKATLPDVVDKNVPPSLQMRSGKFKDAWEGANKEHQNTLKFYQVPDKVGDDKVQRNLRSVLTKQDKTADAAIFDFFTPGNKQTGTEGFDKLAAVVGKQDAQKYLQSYLFRGIESGNINKMVRVYEGLSPAQRKAITGNTKQGKYLEAAGKIQRSLGKSAHGYMGHGLHGLMGFGLPGAAAGGGALMMGASPEDSFKTAAGVGLASLGAGVGASRMVPFMPKSANLLSRVGKEGRRNSGRLSSLGALEGMNYFNQGRNNGSPGNTATD